MMLYHCSKQVRANARMIKQQIIQEVIVVIAVIAMRHTLYKLTATSFSKAPRNTLQRRSQQTKDQKKKP